MKILLTEDFFKKTDALSNEILGQLFSTLRKISLNQFSGLDFELIEGLKKTWKARINDQYRIAMAREGENCFPGYVWDHQTPRLRSESKPHDMPTRILKPEFPGIRNEHFEILESAEKVHNLSQEKAYHERLYDVFSPILDTTGKTLRRIFQEKLDQPLFPHIAHPHNVNRRPIIWLVFTGDDDPSYQNYPQIGFHVGIGTAKTDTFVQNDRKRHLSIKVAEFGSRPGYRRFFESWADPQKGEKVRRYFYKRSKRIGKNYVLHFRKSMNEDKSLALAEVSREENLMKFFSETDEIARSEGFFALEIQRTYVGEGLNHFRNHSSLISELASNLAELIPIYFLFTKSDPVGAWKRYQPRLEKFRETKMYCESSLQHTKNT